MDNQQDLTSFLSSLGHPVMIRSLLVVLGKLLLGWIGGCLVGSGLYWLLAITTEASMGLAYLLVWGGGVLGMAIAALLHWRRQSRY